MRPSSPSWTRWCARAARRLARSRHPLLPPQLLGCSVDSQYCHLAWIKTPRKEGGLGGSLNYPLISDINKSISRAYGVLIENEEDPDVGVALRGTFIIDPKGVVRSVSINDLGVGRSVDEILRTLSAFQHSEAHGDVCPGERGEGLFFS